MPEGEAPRSRRDRHVDLRGAGTQLRGAEPPPATSGTNRSVAFRGGRAIRVLAQARRRRPRVVRETLLAHAAGLAGRPERPWCHRAPARGLHSDTGMRRSIALEPSPQSYGAAGGANEECIGPAVRSQRRHPQANDLPAMLGIALGIVLGGALWVFLGTALVSLLSRP